MARLSSSIVAAFMFFAALSNALPTLPTLDSDSVQDGDNVPVPDSPDFLPLKLAHFTHNSIKDEALHGISGGLKEREAQGDFFATPSGEPNFDATPEPTSAQQQQQSTPTPTATSSSNNPLQAIPVLGPLAGSLLGGGLIPK